MEPAKSESQSIQGDPPPKKATTALNPSAAVFTPRPKEPGSIAGNKPEAQSPATPSEAPAPSSANVSHPFHLVAADDHSSGPHGGGGHHGSGYPPVHDGNGTRRERRSSGGRKGRRDLLDDDGGGSGSDFTPERDPPALPHDMKEAVMRQVEFYFNDENLAIDKQLQGHMRRAHGGGDGTGFVPLTVIGGFAKIKALLPDKDTRNALLAQALAGSHELVLDKRRRSVCRRRPVKGWTDGAVDGGSDTESKEHRLRRTVEAVNLPTDATEAGLRELFSRCGDVESVVLHIRDDPGVPEANRPAGAERGPFAVCQYANAESALKAVRELCDTKNWRGGLRVAPPRGLKSATKRQSSDSQGGWGSDHNQNNHTNAHAQAHGNSNNHSQNHANHNHGGHNHTAGEEGGGGGPPRVRPRSGSAASHAEAVAGDGYRLRAMSESVSASPDALKRQAHRKPRAVSVAESESENRMENNVASPTASSKLKNSSSTSPTRPQGRLYVGTVHSIDGAGGGAIKGDNSRRTKLMFTAADVEGTGEVSAGDMVKYRAWRSETGQWVALQVRKMGSDEAAADARKIALEALNQATQPASGVRINKPTRHLIMAAGPSGRGFGAGRGKVLSSGSPPPANRSQTSTPTRHRPPLAAAVQTPMLLVENDSSNIIASSEKGQFDDAEQQSEEQTSTS